MITFLVSFLILILGYLLYGKLVERIFAPDGKRATPAVTLNDGVDYVPMKPWKIFTIQFLNIAGLGPIFGAIMGAKFGASAYIWIVVGCIFAGAVHDYLAGMLSLRNNGASLPELIGKYLGISMQQFTRLFSIVLMVLVGVVFISGPAGLLQNLTSLGQWWWIGIIFAYYLLASMLPIDKLIGKVYPLFAVALLFMAVGILVVLLIEQPMLPEITDGLQNTHPLADSTPIFPMLFISIACGAISGFHATQSPLMARCMTNEKQGRPIFYGAMIVEVLVALIWAAAANAFFAQNGMGENNAAIIVNEISTNWLGVLGGALAILGVIFAPITSGDTALRSARLIMADMFAVDQKPIKNRLLICVPMFLVAAAILLYSLNDAEGFNIIWRYFAWANQTLGVITLWALSVWLMRTRRKWHWMTLIPAIFMTVVVTLYILIADEGLNLSYIPSVIASITLSLLLTLLFYYKELKRK
ncbi:MAG: carbon starvation CstA family protein [Paludibacteraceae bacterium]|nr:carbon starvation CstA family protein [Paludibacteraceae bacterium]